MRHQELARRSAVTPLSQGGKQRDLWHWNQRALEPWKRGCPTRSVLWKKAITAGPSDGMHVCVCMCVCKYPDPSLLPRSSLLLSSPTSQKQMETEEEGSLGDGVCRGQSPGCRAGQRMERNQMETSQDHLTGWPRLSSMSVERGSVTRGYSDLHLSQPLRSPHPRQPGHWQSRGDPLESLPLPATRVGHRVPLYPQRCEVLRQGEAWEASEA